MDRYVNHPLRQYQPKSIRFLGQGGHAKVLSFHSDSTDQDMVIKIYSALYKTEAENEFDNMQFLDHDNVLKVFEIGTIYEERKKKDEEEGERSSDSSDFEEAKEEAEDGEQEELQADYFIIMERADSSLMEELQRRKLKKLHYSDAELFAQWHTLINVFAYCSYTGITHNDIKPNNILIKN